MGVRTTDKSTKGFGVNKVLDQRSLPFLDTSRIDSPGQIIEKSLRFRGESSSRLSRTFGAPTVENFFTFSFWVRRSFFSTTQYLFGASTNHSLGFTSGNLLNLTFGGISAGNSTIVFNQPSDWYHILWTQKGSSHLVYVNGNLEFSATATSNTFNTAIQHQIGALNSSSYFSGYLAFVYFIDGQSLLPSSFTTGTGNSIKPVTYSGTYGNNGFFLNFLDNSGTTSSSNTGIGKDSSGKGNYWTTTNISVTSGNTNDSTSESPSSYGFNGEIGGGVAGQYCIFDYFNGGWRTDYNIPSYGGLAFWNDGSNSGRANLGVSSGKWYWEVLCTEQYSNMGVGISNANRTSTWYYSSNGNKVSPSGSSAFGSSWANGSIIGVALDMNTGQIWFSSGNTWQASGNPAAGTNPALTGITTQAVFPWVTISSSSGIANFGSTPFAYTPPAGFRTLCTKNIFGGYGGSSSPILKTSDTLGQALLSSTPSNDANSSFISLALPMNGANNGTTFTDYGLSIKVGAGVTSSLALSRQGDTKTSTAQSKFYGSSGLFDGTGDYIIVGASNSSGFLLGSSIFTIEAWVYRSATGATHYIVGKGDDNGYWLYVSSANKLLWSQVNSSSSGYQTIVDTVDFPQNQWVHVAAVSNGTTVTLYKNGTSIGTCNVTTHDGNGQGPTNSAVALSVGSYNGSSSSSPWNGYMQDVRIYKGVAKYTSNFTP